MGIVKELFAEKKKKEKGGKVTGVLYISPHVTKGKRPARVPNILDSARRKVKKVR